MNTPIAIEVPASDVEDLHTLGGLLADDVYVGDVRALDGDAVAQAITAISVSSIPVLKAWLRARVDARKSSVVSWQGNRLSGFTASEVAEIIEALEKLQNEGEED